MAAVLAAGCGDGGGGSGGTGGTGGTGGSANVPRCEVTSFPTFGVSVSLFAADWVPTTAGELPDSASVAGTVTAVESGALPFYCGQAWEGDDGVWVTIQDADAKEWIACYSARVTTAPVQVGDSVTADYELHEDEWDIGGLTLTLRKDGALKLFAVKETLGNIPWPPEIDAHEGDLLCSSPEEEDCGKEEYAVSVEAGGSSLTLNPGQSGTVGGFEFHVGAWFHVLIDGACDAPSYAHHLLVVPAPAP